MLTFGTQEFFDTFREILNRDVTFRELGRGVYNATELIVIKDLGIGIWQETIDGEISSFSLVKKSDIESKERLAELVYYVETYDAMIKIITGQESFVELVINDEITFKGSIKKVTSIQAPSERMEILLRDLTRKTIIPTRIQYQKWLSERGFI
ncbi:MAG: hypothetical protein QXW39_09325 [Candidatus Bathyarchaeia archaeon]